MAAIKQVANKKGTPPSTSGFPKSVQNKKVSKQAAIPMAKNGGMKSKKGC